MPSLLQMVMGSLAAGTFPVDHDGVYFVLTSADVMEVTGYCETLSFAVTGISYCGWHSFEQWRPTGVRRWRPNLAAP